MNFIASNDFSLLYDNMLDSSGDKDPEAMETVAHNIKPRRWKKSLKRIRRTFEHAPAAENSRTLLVLNPPYGKRLSVDAPRLYAEIGKKR